MKIIIISFDMETDIGSWTTGERGIKEGTPEVLRVLANHKTPATFLFTGREAQSNPKIVERVLSEGHEVGCHSMYHENVGKAVFEMPGSNFMLEAEVRGRLALATDVIEMVAGIRPVSFRAPRLFGSTGMINALEDLGYVADSSFPAYFYGRGFLPFNPSSDDWSLPGDSNLVEIPLFYDTDAAAVDTTMRSRDQWPVLRLKGARSFGDLCKRMLNNVKDQDGDSILCVYLHPWEFADMPSGIVTDEATIEFKPFLFQNCGRPTIEALDQFVDIMLSAGVRFVTMKDLATEWSND